MIINLIIIFRLYIDYYTEILVDAVEFLDILAPERVFNATNLVFLLFKREIVPYSTCNHGLFSFFCIGSPVVKGKARIETKTGSSQ